MDRRSAIRSLITAAASPAIAGSALAEGDAPRTTDVAIIGAGFAGLSAAKALRAAGHETLVIEAYERLGRDKEIMDKDNNYLMFGALVDKACGENGIRLGREAKAALREIKEHGDRSAHNRRANAVRPELERIRAGARTAIEELINIARLKD